VTVEESRGLQFEVEYVEGMQFDRGYISPYFVTNADRMTAELEEHYLLITESKISSVQDMLPMLERLVQTGKKEIVIIGEEVATMLETATVLDYERSLAGFRRINRRLVLGDAAADDTALSEEHSRLRGDGNWLGLKFWNRRRDARLRASMNERIRRYVDAAEPGTLVSLFAGAPQTRDTLPNGQVPFWLMALEAVRTVVANTLGLLATHPAARTRVLEEIAAADAAHGRGTVAGLADLRFVRACIQESIRLWPAAPTLVRRTTAETEWQGTVVPSGTRVLIPAAVFHRRRTLPYANRFAPEIWLDGSGDADTSLNLFSRGGAQCAGRNLALVLVTATLAELLRHAEFELLRPKLSPDRPLPYAINPLATRFAVQKRPST